MSHSLRAKIKGLRYKGIITDKECDRLRKALDNEDVLDKIRAEIEQMPSELTADGRRMIRRGSVFRIIDKHTKGEEYNNTVR